MTSITSKAGSQRGTIRFDMRPIEPQKNEVLLREGSQWLYFTQPHQIIQTHTLSEVPPALRQIQDLVEHKNWHAAGFLSYEAAPAFDNALQTRPLTGFPLLWFGLYPPPRLVSLPEPASPQPALTWSPAVDRQTYNHAIAQIKEHIARGRTYQVNYTMRLRAAFNADPWNFFLHLAQTQNNHAAYLDTGRFVIASASPELFFTLDGETITCRPMKGTARRGRTTLEDRQQAQWLHASEKNRAENVMIVDMIRNDLNRIARVGSVRVPQLFAVEKYPTLWQMTSTVTAQTAAPLMEIFAALFPCASITGAPKVSTMKIIAALETTPRGIYTGSIGHIAPGRRVSFNVAIRTIWIDRDAQTAEYGAGGGIVWDSTSTDEYAEALLKTRVLTEPHPSFSLLETMRWTPHEGFFLREKHIARLLDSAEYFDFPAPSQTTLETYLDDIASRFTSPQRVRILLARNGELSFTAQALPTENPSQPLKAALAKQAVNSADVFLFHKTTHRQMYETALQNFLNSDDVLLYNERGELTEFTIGNLLVRMGGKLYTPPVSCGVLPGTFRAHLLETGQAQERIIQQEELSACTELFRINSVRGRQKVVIIN
ncbi:MAG: aminodeoxychorismate synthase component I [Anaerolineales bacterium]